jgi:membrane protease YdiL (CAAX protease family)
MNCGPVTNQLERRDRSALKFFALVFALSAPLWLIGAATGLQILRGLPISSLMVVAPAAAALIIVYRERQRPGVSFLLKRAFDCWKVKPRLWYAPIILLMPCATILTCLAMRMMGRPIDVAPFPIGLVPVMFAAFLVAGLSEELGWSGYAIDLLLRGHSALWASVILGAVWAVWHLIPLWQAHRSAEWIAWWSLYTLALRVLIVWIYSNTRKSVFGAALFHAFSNVSGITFANCYDPRITGVILTITAAVVAATWGPRTLAGALRDNR